MEPDDTKQERPVRVRGIRIGASGDARHEPQPLPACPKPGCASDKVVCNGGYQTKNLGLVNRFICRRCGHKWKQQQNVSRILTRAGIRDSEEVVLKASALMALGLPLEKVEGLIERKSETISTWLRRCFANPSAWGEITARLVSEYGIAQGEVMKLSDFLSRVARGEINFHADSRRTSAATINPKRRRQRMEGVTKEGLRQVPQFRHLDEEQLENLCQQYLLHGHTTETPNKSLVRAQELLRRRIETVLGERVIVTGEGDYFRAEGDRRVNRWIKNVAQFDANGHEQVLRLLSVVQRLVFDQVRNPDAAAHVHAKLEGARRWDGVGSWPEKMTVDCLAQGLGMPLEMFISKLKSIAKMLRRPSAQA